MRGKIKQKEGHPSGMVSEEGQVLGGELSEKLDVAVNLAKIALHDARDDEKVGQVKGGFGPSQSGNSETLPGHSRGKGPHAVAFEHGLPSPKCKEKTLASEGWDFLARPD